MPIWDGEDGDGPEKGTNPKQRLMHWIQAKVPDLPITNFTSQWNNDRAVGALVDAVAPLLCPNMQDWNPKDSVQNASEATYRSRRRLTQHTQGAPCVNPQGKQGYCVTIRQCEPLLYILRTQRNAAGDFLRSSVCGFEGLDPRVCCPSDSGVTQPNVEAPRAAGIYGPLYPDQCGISNATYTKVVDGVPAKLGAWPWIVALGYRSAKRSNTPKWLCGGTLISARHVVTAEHCVYNRNDLYLARLGELDLNSNNDGANPIDVLIEKATIHPRYSAATYTNDIAVLRLRQDVAFSNTIQPICLPLDDKIRTKDIVRHFPYIAGWGAMYFNGPSSSRLLQLQIPVVEPERCRRAFEPFKTTVIDERVMCAGFEQGGKDACQGDSGGPVMYPRGKTFFLVGVVSYGFRCAEPGFPGVYTKVTAFLDFIQANLV